MKTQRWERTKEILEQALRLPPDERQAYLDAACGPDGELRSEVESLIASHEAAGSQFLAATAPEVLELTSPISSPQSRLNQVIGHYRLVEEIGRGGMGQVWLAEQTAPVRRQVALKLIRAGMFDDEMLKRFQLERQSLAIMDHPAIAKVFDAGATPDGQPYFVMEYVPGVPITDYCDQKRLKIGGRLELFIKVCEAVQHAHQKAIIHRDLKPANILVQEVDGKPVPRIIDFGLAKATSPQIAGESLYTHLGSFVGTPGYAFRCLLAGRSAVCLTHGVPPFSSETGEGAASRRNASTGARGGSATAQHEGQHRSRNILSYRRSSRHRAEATGELVARRSRLADDEGAGERPEPPLRNRV
jgi:non-specific serine/threonine protein kinase/serine/threonine-protein kinase